MSDLQDEARILIPQSPSFSLGKRRKPPTGGGPRVPLLIRPFSTSVVDGGLRWLQVADPGT